MKPYEDDPHCDKCGAAGAMIGLKHYGALHMEPNSEEYLLCKCNRCGWAWVMATKEAKTETTEKDSPTCD